MRPALRHGVADRPGPPQPATVTPRDALLRRPRQSAFTAGQTSKGQANRRSPRLGSLLSVTRPVRVPWADHTTRTNARRNREIDFPISTGTSFHGTTALDPWPMPGARGAAMLVMRYGAARQNPAPP